MFNRQARKSKSKRLLRLASVVTGFIVLSATSCPPQTDQGNQCVVPDSNVYYSLAGFFNGRAVVDRAGLITDSNTHVEAAAEFDVEQGMSQIISCDHLGTMRGHELAWIDQDGLHIQDLDSGSETYSDASLVRGESSGEDSWTYRWIVDYSDSYVVVEQLFACCGGNEEFSVFADSRSTNLVQGIYAWGDQGGNNVPGQFALDGHQLAVIENPCLPIRMRIVDLDRGTSRDISHQGGECLSGFGLSDQRFVWGETLGDNQSSISVTVYAVDIVTLSPTVLVSFPNGTDEPYDFSENYMLVKHPAKDPTEYDLWSLVGPTAKIRTISTNGQPSFLTGQILLAGPADGPFTLVDPSTGSQTVISNPFGP